MCKTDFERDRPLPVRAPLPWIEVAPGVPCFRTEHGEKHSASAPHDTTWRERPNSV